MDFKEITELIGDYPVQEVLSKQCGQTCAEFITGIPTKKICDALDNNYSTNIFTELVPFIRKQGFDIYIVYAYESHLSFDDIPDDSLIRLHKNDGGGHFVVKKNGVYVDPSGEIVLSYSEKKFKVSHYAPFKKRES